MSHNPQKLKNLTELKRCPACEGIRGQDHLPDCFTVAANKLWSNLNLQLTSPVSQPDGYAGEPQAITPEPERNAFAGQPYATQPNSLPRTATGYTRASGPGPYATGRVTIQKEDGSYERVPVSGQAIKTHYTSTQHEWFPTPLYRAVLDQNGIPALELVSDSPTAREIALEERIMQCHKHIREQYETVVQCLLERDNARQDAKNAHTNAEIFQAERDEARNALVTQVSIATTDLVTGEPWLNVNDTLPLAAEPVRVRLTNGMEQVAIYDWDQMRFTSVDESVVFEVTHWRPL